MKKLDVQRDSGQRSEMSKKEEFCKEIRKEEERPVDRSKCLETHSPSRVSLSSIPRPSEFQMMSVSRLRHLMRAPRRDSEFAAMIRASFCLETICPRKTTMLE